MKKYYLNRGDENLGPFSLEDLREHRIAPETMVWFIGLEGWTPARNVRELHPLFESIPGHELTSSQGVEKYYISKMENDESFFLKHIDKFLFLFLFALAVGIIMFLLGLNL
ncbi:DUF4339 domain-containing protein [Flavobacterium microcysteis]|uniref:DUF4339 domain-containing protein n=1 Tax=Flavobacterium microcysteis TaxID=2596891 RepID=A0A501Q4X6_9FLAO|nr:DUF4339 domain-containing protein [Flavobacterium microcysteis]TPD67066.1 DUF4339 domain-containing protein [Flavobacterium microcysteis]